MRLPHSLFRTVPSPGVWRVSLTAAVFVLAAFVPPAAAQRAAGPYAGVLGTTEEANARHTLTVRGSLFGTWDDIITETEIPTGIDNPDVDRRFLRSGLAAGANGGLTHARRTGRTEWLSSASSELRMYGTESQAIAATFNGRTNLSASLNSRITAAVGGGWLYSPFYELSPGYGTAPQSTGAFNGGFGLATAAERNTLTDVDASLGVRLTSRDTFDARVNARHWDFLDQPESTVTNYGGGARYRHSLTRALGVYAGWGREEARYEFADDRIVVTDTIDVGVDYGDVLEFSRRTAVSFGFSTSAVRWEDDTHWRVNGSAALTRAFGRSGAGVLQYSRDTEYTAGFREPLLTDTVSGGFSNQIGRRTSWSANGGYIRGEIGFGEQSRRFDVYDAGGRVTRALTRTLGIFGDYSFYWYEVPAGSTTFTFLPKFSRQSVTFGLVLWAPIIEDTRPARETR